MHPMGKAVASRIGSCLGDVEGDDQQPIAEMLYSMI